VPWYEFIWDGENDEHLAEHGVTPEEFAEVVCNPDRVDTSRSSGRPIAFGPTSTGKYLACVYELLDEFSVYAITAFEAEDE
jgi:uncharacterized DUF497 family protein